MSLRFGVLGAARITPTALLEPAASRPDVTVDVVAARDPARAEAFASEHGIERVVADYAAVIADPDVDCIFNPLPMSLHAHWTIAALEAGKHVLCEKPFASNAAEAEAMVEAAERTGKALVEAFHWRYHPLAAAITDAVSTLGDLTGGRAHFRVSIDDRDDLRWGYETSGGSLMDLGCYCVQWLRHVFGPEPTVVDATATIAPGSDHRVDASMDATLRLGDATFTLSSSMVENDGDISLEVEGTEGRLQVVNPLVPQYGHSLTLTDAAGTRTWELEPSGGTYDHQLAAFVDHVQRGTPVPTGGLDSIQTMRVIDDIYDVAGLPRRGT